MGKKKHKKAKAGAIPKHVAGVKLPKAVRAAGDALIEQAMSPAGREVLASAMMVAAGAIARSAEAARTTGDGATDPTRDGPTREGDAGTRPGGGDRLGQMLGMAANAAMAGFMAGRRPAGSDGEDAGKPH